MMKFSFVLVFSIFAISLHAADFVHDSGASPANQPETFAAARSAGDPKKDKFEDELFNDMSVLAKREGEAPAIAITSWSKDKNGMLVEGTNSAGETYKVRVKKMIAGGYANFFGALFVFDGESFHKLNRQNVRQYQLTKRYIGQAVSE